MTQQIVRMGPCGGGGGNSRDDVDMRGVDRVVKVSLCHGNTVHAMTVLYDRGGREEWTDQWGGPGGVVGSIICLQPDEYFTSVEGHCGEFQGNFVVRSLTLVSNLQSYGPYGAQTGVPFALPAAGGKILGFHARSGHHLDALGTYVKMEQLTTTQSTLQSLVQQMTQMQQVLRGMASQAIRSPFPSPPITPHTTQSGQPRGAPQSSAAGAQEQQMQWTPQIGSLPFPPQAGTGYWPFGLMLWGLGAQGMMPGAGMMPGVGMPVVRPGEGSTSHHGMPRTPEEFSNQFLNPNPGANPPGPPFE